MFTFKKCNDRVLTALLAAGCRGGSAQIGGWCTVCWNKRQVEMNRRQRCFPHLAEDGHQLPEEQPGIWMGVKATTYTASSCLVLSQAFTVPPIILSFLEMWQHWSGSTLPSHPSSSHQVLTENRTGFRCGELVRVAVAYEYLPSHSHSLPTSRLQLPSAPLGCSHSIFCKQTWKLSYWYQLCIHKFSL